MKTLHHVPLSEQDEIVERYARREVTLGRAAELLDITESDAQDLMAQRGIPRDITIEDVLEDLQVLTRLRRV